MVFLNSHPNGSESGMLCPEKEISTRGRLTMNLVCQERYDLSSFKKLKRAERCGVGIRDVERNQRCSGQSVAQFDMHAVNCGSY